MTENFYKLAEELCLQAEIRPYCYSVEMATDEAFSKKPLGNAIAYLLMESKECEVFPKIDAKFIRNICRYKNGRYKVIKNGKKFSLSIRGYSIDSKQWEEYKQLLWK